MVSSILGRAVGVLHCDVVQSPVGYTKVYCAVFFLYQDHGLRPRAARELHYPLHCQLADEILHLLHPGRCYPPRGMIDGLAVTEVYSVVY